VIREVLREPSATRSPEKESMEYLIGVALALRVCAFAMLPGFDPYPTVLIVIATCFVMFDIGISPSHALRRRSGFAPTR
jgi:hypothetical protein